MKKAQLQIMENVFVIIIIFIILFIAFVFSMVMQRQSNIDEQEKIEQLNLIKKSQVLNFLPELKCSDNNNIDPDCYDLFKIEVFKEKASQDLLYYKTLLGNIKLEIVRFDPSPEINSEVGRWTVFDNPRAEDNGFTQIQFPVLLKDIAGNSDYFGIIYLSVYR